MPPIVNQTSALTSSTHPGTANVRTLNFFTKQRFNSPNRKSFPRTWPQTESNRTRQERDRVHKVQGESSVHGADAGRVQQRNEVRVVGPVSELCDDFRTARRASGVVDDNCKANKKSFENFCVIHLIFTDLRTRLEASNQRSEEPRRLRQFRIRRTGSDAMNHQRILVLSLLDFPISTF